MNLHWNMSPHLEIFLDHKGHNHLGNILDVNVPQLSVTSEYHLVYNL
jgi:phage tail tube protein FII